MTFFSKSVLLRLPIVSLVETCLFLIIPCNVACLNGDNTNGLFYDICYGCLCLCVISLDYVQYIQLYIQICDQ